MIEANGADLCTEAFGDRSDPPVLLIMGTGASMIWWEDEFCRMLVEGGRFVIRYDHRDTGRSTTYPVGSPGYSGSDLLNDPIAVLDAYDVPSAHVVGVSAGGAFAQELVLAHPARVLSVVLISTTFATASGRSLPAPTREFGSFLSTARVDWSDDDSVVDYMVGYMRMLAGVEREFDEPAAREFVRRDIERAHDYPAVQNHDSITDDSGDHPPVSSIAVPTLVIHGTADPMFPIEHGMALAEAIPGARLIRIEGMGHGFVREDWEEVSEAILAHTG